MDPYDDLVKAGLALEMAVEGDLLGAAPLLDAQAARRRDGSAFVYVARDAVG